MDNTAIARIAASDLAGDALNLLTKYGSNDDVVFFLGRLIWQGEMTECVPALMQIASNSGRGLYARIASIRAVMSVGTIEQKDALWGEIVGQTGRIDRRLLAELVDGATYTKCNIDLLLIGLEKAELFERFNSTGLELHLHEYIDRMPVMADRAKDHPLSQLLDGLARLLQKEPVFTHGAYQLSEEYTWVMAPALHIVDRLVAARSAQALLPAAIEVMRNMPALYFRGGGDFSEYKLSLGENVPSWPELNDLLYWTSIEQSRSALEKSHQALVNDWQISIGGHFWGFKAGDFERCLGWVTTKAKIEDRLIALSRCVDIYMQGDRPSAWLALLNAVVQDDDSLRSRLEAHLNPPRSAAMEDFDAQEQEWRQQREAQQKEEQERRASWVHSLKENPDRIVHATGAEPGVFTTDQYYLLRSSWKDQEGGDFKDEANWRSLIPEFGEAVAHAYRDAAIAHWRAYQPRLRSEGAEAGSTPYSLAFAMVGLSIEAENVEFAQNLDSDDARQAFRYITWQLNGFPSWFEQLYRAHPVLGLEAVTTELTWELENQVENRPLHYILHDILYHAPWLHKEVGPSVLSWLNGNNVPNADALRYCLNILAEAGTEYSQLSSLAKSKVCGAARPDQLPHWFALWVGSNPTEAIPTLEKKLSALPREDAVELAEQFVINLLGDRHGNGERASAYRNARDLKSLYILMHSYIRGAEDIDRVGKGVYSPTRRDNAQHARDTLFAMLAEVPGAEGYAAIKALESEHPDPTYRCWMARSAYARATADADEPLWTVRQVRSFSDDIKIV